MSFPLAPLIALVGPTGSGKSALGVKLAKRFAGEVLACDSTQVYRGFDIGTAKPTAAERALAPHHLLDFLDPEETFTAGGYRLRAIAVLEDLRNWGRLPILTAGTGLYLRALLEGLADAPMRSEELRARLMRRAECNRPGYLHRLLARMDPIAAARIALQDTPKLVRAIEVSVLAGKPITEVHRAGAKSLEGFRAIKIGLNPQRTALYERIERRTLDMVDRGWVAEIRALLARGVPPAAKPFSFIGYPQLRAHLEGGMELPAAIAAIQQATSRYAKRQVTWFRKEPGVRWIEGFG
ncbi:MAG: tRNA (adenosine(37)-N6)-dimethylallyltransferase MiaA, partial [Bryobacteraceae bacterium]